jgi:hypothetical protein
MTLPFCDLSSLDIISFAKKILGYIQPLFDWNAVELNHFEAATLAFRPSKEMLSLKNHRLFHLLHRLYQMISSVVFYAFSANIILSENLYPASLFCRNFHILSA